MTAPRKARTLSVSIRRSPRAVYAFVADPRNLPRWGTTFIRSVRKAGGSWILETPQGPMPARFAAKNGFGVLDHFIRPSPGVEVFVPMRVVPNGAGSETLFTLFKRPGMTARDWAKDAGLVRRDLRTLKRVLESRRKRERRPR